MGERFSSNSSGDALGLAVEYSAPPKFQDNGLYPRNEMRAPTREKLSQKNLPMLLLISEKPEPKAKAQNSETVIDIKDVGGRLGTWQQERYTELGIQKLHLGQDRVKLDLKSATEKSEYFNSIKLDKTVSFKFQREPWVLSELKGMKFNGAQVNQIDSVEGKIIFHTDKGDKSYGKAVQGYFKAIFDPMMRKDQRD
ncbi:MAG: hypothetical protein K2X27_15645 [Candidatus Obscuribacterales bacterium]|nr:hypothetical protein [Candidatus Obscuribacterales bacterium]